MAAPSSSHSNATLPPPAPGLQVRMSYRDYLAWAPETMLAEWNDGEVTVGRPPLDEHQRVLNLLNRLMSDYVELHDLGAVRVAPLEMKLWPGGPSREPDVFF